jgi:prolyl oligopeptidase
MVVARRRSVADPYRWLEDGDSPSTQRWIRAEQARYNAALASWPAHRWLSDRITAWLHRDEWSVPRHRGGREFATLLRSGADHPQLLCRDNPRDAPRVLVDPITDGGPGAALDAWEPNPSGRLISFQLSRGGIERGELTIRSVDTEAFRTLRDRSGWDSDRIRGSLAGCCW